MAQGLKLQLVGHRFGRLLVLSEHSTPEHGTRWNCLCDCGKEKVVRGDVLMRNRRGTRSCGCLAKEISSCLHTKHGMERTPTYKSWVAMKERCDNPNAPNFKRYGGRGISYCVQWRDFQNFLIDMGVRPKKTSLGRINNDGDYDPSNCSWQDASTQQRNKSNTKLSVEIASEIRRAVAGGERKYLVARRLGVSFSNVKDVVAGRCWL